VFGDESGTFAVEAGIVGRPRRKTVHVAIAHAEDGGDQYVS
jgi:hypothetical protein